MSKIGRSRTIAAFRQRVRGTAVLLLLIAWVLIYLLIYLPRGMVG